MVLDIEQIVAKVAETKGDCMITHVSDSDYLGSGKFELHVNVDRSLGYERNENFLTYTNCLTYDTVLESFLQASVMHKLSDYSEQCKLEAGDYFIMLQDERIVKAIAVVVDEPYETKDERAFVHWAVDERQLDAYDNGLNTLVIGYAKMLTPITDYHETKRMLLR